MTLNHVISDAVYEVVRYYVRYCIIWWLDRISDDMLDLAQEDKFEFLRRVNANWPDKKIEEGIPKCFVRTLISYLPKVRDRLVRDLYMDISAIDRYSKKFKDNPVLWKDITRRGLNILVERLKIYVKRGGLYLV
jgi:hypothetical protein